MGCLAAGQRAARRMQRTGPQVQEIIKRKRDGRGSTAAKGQDGRGAREPERWAGHWVTGEMCVFQAFPGR
jgi:ribosomal protein L15